MATDTLVARHIMGWRECPLDGPVKQHVSRGGYITPDGTPYRFTVGHMAERWYPDRNIAHAWHVVEAVPLKYREGTVDVTVSRSVAGNPKYRYSCAIRTQIYQNDGWADSEGKFVFTQDAETVEAAICGAALKAIGVEVSK